MDDPYIIVLSVKNEKELQSLLDKATQQKIKTHIFREPDFFGELTAIAFSPSSKNKKLLSNLPLAGKTVPPSDALERERSLKADFLASGVDDGGEAVV